MELVSIVSSESHPLADKIIRSKTQISPPSHPITSHQFQSLGTCQESETQLAHYMSFSSGCPPRALTFVRTPECHDTPEISAITISPRNLNNPVDIPCFQISKTPIPGHGPILPIWHTSLHIRYIPRHSSAFTSTPRVANLGRARSAETRVPLMKSAAPRFSSFHGT